jgi:hypothetical protein
MRLTVFRYTYLCCLLLLAQSLCAQQQDSTAYKGHKKRVKQLSQVTIADPKRSLGYTYLNNVDGMAIFAGKKSEVILQPIMHVKYMQK